MNKYLEKIAANWMKIQERVAGGAYSDAGRVFSRDSSLLDNQRALKGSIRDRRFDLHLKGLKDVRNAARSGNSLKDTLQSSPSLKRGDKMTSVLDNPRLKRDWKEKPDLSEPNHVAKNTPKEPSEEGT